MIFYYQEYEYASGSMDKCMYIWSMKEGKIVKTYTGNGGIFEVCWNKEGDRIAACFSNNIVCVLVSVGKQSFVEFDYFLELTCLGTEFDRLQLHQYYAMGDHAVRSGSINRNHP
ncbi:WD40 repeat-containing protein HOS15 [Vitis vinifera]|uniref:WD40 repeat-containing protein HOS15 n=1 Tax=Vitis vinifera TaxID=29760 RepID=A0A438ITI5_VITVI|nr:WD40 repeat-containing protein HOS15 [Vitis vinifera]